MKGFSGFKKEDINPDDWHRMKTNNKTRTAESDQRVHAEFEKLEKKDGKYMIDGKGYNSPQHAMKEGVSLEQVNTAIKSNKAKQDIMSELGPTPSDRTGN